MKAFTGLMKKVYKGEGGFTLIELLIVIIILGILAAVVAFNVAGFLGAGTEETAKTESMSVQTAIIAGMADNSVASVNASTITAGSDPDDYLDAEFEDKGSNVGLGIYLQSPTHGNWHWTASGVVDYGCYAGGGTCCALTTNGTWICTDGLTANADGTCG